LSMRWAGLPVAEFSKDFLDIFIPEIVYQGHACLIQEDHRDLDKSRFRR
jgi:hypothetical protein